MKKEITAVSAILACILLNTPAVKADDKKDIQTLYSKLQAGFLNKDADAISKLSTPDYTQKMSNGTTMNRAQVTQNLKMQFSMTKKVKKMDMKLSNISVKGKTASGTSSYTFTGEIVDPDGHMGAPGKSHLLSVSGSEHATMVKTPKGWRFKSISSDQEKMTMDGKPLSVSSGPPKSK